MTDTKSSTPATATAGAAAAGESKRAPRTVVVAATQMACSRDREANMKRAEALVRKAAAQGAQIILIQELFDNVYFCQDQLETEFSLAADCTVPHTQQCSDHDRGSCEGDCC
jgi:predicted amidohydrolase